MLTNKIYRKLIYIIGGLLGLLGIIYLVTPKPPLLENYTYSTAVYDTNGRLLNLGLSMDDQYRLFVPYEQIPQDAVKALLLYEDRYYFYHTGINPLRFIKAAVSMAAGGRKQGASTLSMQVARIVFHIDSSTIFGKIEQVLRALQLEMFYSKNQILEAYFNLAPYGSNIEGIGAASLIYFNTRAADLNLPQIMALTVIPQNPTKRFLLNPKAKDEVDQAVKRLKKIWKEVEGLENEEILNLPLEVLNHKPLFAPHLVQYLKRTQKGEVFTTIDLDYQLWLEEIVNRYVKKHNQNGIYNAAAILVNRKDMSVKALIGSNDFFNVEIQGQVDGTRAFRSPGSVMKPFIYAKALEMGIIHPRTMLKDVPKNYGAYMPENFEHNFYGMINATDSLVKSRNIPAVELLLKIGLDNYYKLLEASQVQRLKPAEYYGLALALGGFELTMQDIAKAYAMLANGGKFRELRLLRNQPQNDGVGLISPEAAYLTMEMLAQNPYEQRSRFAVNRHSYKVYWKTGTSFGYRDAWTAGVVGDYVLVVWIGNFDSSSNPTFVGRRAAAPLFFEIVKSLAKNNSIITDDLNPDRLNLAKVQVCEPTGDIADSNCTKVVSTYFIPGITRIKLSNISRMIPIDIITGKRACRHRPPQTEMKSYEFWPTDVLSAYEAAGVPLKRPPEFGEDCPLIDTFFQGKAPNIVYPGEGSKFMVNVNKLDQEKISLKAATDSDATKVFWFWNGRLIATSASDESIEVKPQIGDVELKAVDDKGRVNSIKIKIAPLFL